MSHRSPLRELPLALIALAFASVPTQGRAHSKHDCTTRVEWNANTGEVALIDGNRRNPVAPKHKTFEVEAKRSVCVTVLGISTALQQVERRESGIDVANLAAVNAFLPAVGSLFADRLVGGTKTLDGYMKRLAEIGLKTRGLRGEDPLQGAVAAVRRVVDGDGGLKAVRREVLFTVAHIASEPDRSSELAGDLGQRLGTAIHCEGGAGECDAHLTALPQAVAAYVALQRAVADNGELSDQVERKEALDVLEGFENVFQLARETEELLSAVLPARSSFDIQDPVEIDWSHGAMLGLVVSPRSEPVLAPWAPRRSTSVTIRFVPKSTVRFVLGAPLLVVVPGARVPIYGKKGGTIHETGTFDGRFAPGLSLGLTAGALDHSRNGGPALVIPAITIVPFADYGAGYQFAAGGGIGAAVTWRYAFAGASVYWYRYGKLNHARVGDPIGNFDAVPLQSTYSKATLALSLGVALY